jgi:hypothetical protein
VRTKSDVDNAALRAELLELIETIILYKLPRLSREEIQAMLKIYDIRQSRLYQEAQEEARCEFVQELLVASFGPLPPHVEARLQAMTMEELVSVGKASRRATSLKDLGLED